jgi:hypothetical protein
MTRAFLPLPLMREWSFMSYVLVDAPCGLSRLLYGALQGDKQSASTIYWKILLFLFRYVQISDRAFKGFGGKTDGLG